MELIFQVLNDLVIFSQITKLHKIFYTIFRQVATLFLFYLLLINIQKPLILLYKGLRCNYFVFFYYFILYL